MVEFIPGHTTKARIAVSYGPGSEAGLPESLCLKANWSGNHMSSDACVNEARFYKELASRLPLTASTCFYADWDDDAKGKTALLVLEEMLLRVGRFDSSARAISIDKMRNSLVG